MLTKTSKQGLSLVLMALCLQLIPIAVQAAEPGSATGQTSPANTDSGPLSLEDALNRVEREHPGLVSLRQEQALLAIRAQFAGTGPNPALSFLAEDFAGSAAFTDDRFTQFTLELSQALPLSDRLERSRQLAKVNQQLAYWEYRLKRQELGAMVYSAYARLWQLQNQHRLATEILRTSTEIAELLAKGVNAGKLAPTVQIQAELEREGARSELARLELEQQRLSRELALLWSGSESRLQVLAPPPGLPDLESLRLQLSQHPRLARWQSEQIQRDATLYQAQAQATPDLNLSGGLRYHPPFDWGAVLLLELPLAMNSSHQAAIAEAQLRRQTWESEREREAKQLWAQFQQLSQELTAHQHLIDGIRRQTTLAAELEQAAQKAFKAGKVPAQDVLLAYRASIQLRRQLLAAEGEQLFVQTELLSLSPIVYPADPQLEGSE